MAKFFLTGATGFVGSCIVRYLTEHGESVAILTREKALNWRLKDIRSDIEVVEGNLLEDKLEQEIRKISPDYVFHLAAYGSLPVENDVNKIIDINVKGTINLINAIKKVGVKLFVNTGSSSEYGVLDAPMKETDPTFPINNYGISKLAATLYCKKESEANKLPVITFRLFSPFGYFEAFERLIPSVIIPALHNKDISLSKPSNVRDFIFIEDVVSAYISATKVSHIPGTIYNIGSGKQHSVNEVVREILNQTKSKSRARWSKVEKQARQIEPTMWEADIVKAKQILNWEPKYTLEDGLIKAIQWFKNNQKLYANY